MSKATVIQFEADFSEKDAEKHAAIWGGQAEWTALLPYYFRLLEFPNLSFEPKNKKSVHPHPGAAWWNGAIHLLSIGLGWNYLSQGLEAWRGLDYKLGLHPILDFIWNQYGVSINALDIWGVGNLDSYVLEAAAVAVEPARQEIGSQPNHGDSHGIQEMARLLGHDWRFLMVEPLMPNSGGGDNFHLEHHFQYGISGETNGEPIGFSVKRVGQNFELELENYAVLLQALSSIREEYSDALGLLERPIADVRIDGFGYLGRFVFSAESKRWFLTGADFPSKSSSNLKAHLMGN